MGYGIENWCTYRMTDRGEREMLANFTATIIKEVRYVDGAKNETYLTLAGEMAPDEEPEPGEEPEPVELPAVEVSAASWAGMSWVMEAWGVRAVIQPGSGIKDDLRAAIQMGSRPTVETVYKHLGWTRIDGKLHYLHAGGAINAKGPDKSVRVQLPPELSRFSLAGADDPKEGIKATLALLTLSPLKLSWPLLAATFAPIFGPVDFAVHVTGRTGTFKSELLSLFQCFYGPEMDARHLPASWSSTANALEAQAFLAKNSAIVVDDFVPNGTSWQVKQYQVTADKIIRSQGNQSGRARLTDTSSLQQTMYPRGIILSTGEDTPEGHSVRARMLILEMTPGDIEAAKLTAVQALRPKLSWMTAGLVQDLAKNPIDIRPKSQAVRDTMLDVGHSRTPSMLGHLTAVATAVIDYMLRAGGVSSAESKKMLAQAENAILLAGQEQAQYLEAADPVDLFAASLRQIFGAGLGHVRTIAGGVPLKPTLLGWTSESSNSDIPQYRSHGPTIGWVDWEQDELCIDITAGWAVVKKVAGSEMSLTKQTMLKRMKDSGALVRVDEARQRNTIRIQAEDHPRQVVCLSASGVLQTQEKP